jgi:zinc protease
LDLDEAEHLIPYADEVTTKPLLATVPVPDRIIKEKRDDLLNTSTLTLSNGLKVTLKPIDFKKDAIFFSGFAPGGTSLNSDDDYQSAANAAAIVSASGVGNYDAQQLSKYLQGGDSGRLDHAIP